MTDAGVAGAARTAGGLSASAATAHLRSAIADGKAGTKVPRKSAVGGGGHGGHGGGNVGSQGGVDDDNDELDVTARTIGYVRR